MRRALLRTLGLLLLLPLVAAGLGAAEPPPPSQAALKPGQFLWHPEIAPRGPIVVVVSLDEQRAYVYRNGLAIGVSTISSGKAGHETPTGVFTILQKNRHHRSNLYDDAPMPFMQRLTWDGVALHGGALPGYPASHGCVRLPHAFAEKLFATTRTGDTVVVADAAAAPATVVHPSVLAPVAGDGRPLAADPLGASDAWDDVAGAADGPVSVLVSLADRRVRVLRNGAPVASAPLEVEPGFAIGGTVLVVVGELAQDGADPPDAELPRRAWTAHSILGVDGPALAVLQLRLQDRPLRVDPGFARRLHAILAPGSTVLLTDLPALRAAPGTRGLAPVLESDQAPPIGPPSPRP